MGARGLCRVSFTEHARRLAVIYCRTCHSLIEGGARAALLHAACWHPRIWVTDPGALTFEVLEA